MNFTDAELEILFKAWALHARDSGVKPQPWDLPECENLRHAGWLERRRLDDGPARYHWTPQAEMALDINGLTESVKERQN